jgi:hypothetical protein
VLRETCDPHRMRLIAVSAAAVAVMIATTGADAQTYSPRPPRVGDPFFPLAGAGNGDASTDDLIALAEEEAGRPLDDFFDAWLLRRGKPKEW